MPTSRNSGNARQRQRNTSSSEFLRGSAGPRLVLEPNRLTLSLRRRRERLLALATFQLLIVQPHQVGRVVDVSAVRTAATSASGSCCTGSSAFSPSSALPVPSCWTGTYAAPALDPDRSDPSALPRQPKYSAGRFRLLTSLPRPLRVCRLLYSIHSLDVRFIVSVYIARHPTPSEICEFRCFPPEQAESAQNSR
jgi:hypothetical protein